MTDEDKIAAHIQHLTALLQEQVTAANGWPASFVFPEPKDEAERTAMSLFLAEVRKATRAEIRFATEAGRA